VKITAAVVAERCGPFELRELELEAPRDDEVLVRVAASGICHTDLICRDQWIPVPLPAVLGHEGAGVVEAVGSAVTKVRPGDHVGMSYMSCGSCANCLTGKPMYCLSFGHVNFGCTRADGSNAVLCPGEAVHGHFFGQSSFATHAIAHERNVVRLPPDLPLELAAPLGCGVQTGAGGVLNALRPEPGSSLVVFGCGTVGLSAVMAARAAGCTTIVGVDPRPARLELALELGATQILAPADGDVVAEIQALTGFGANYTLETSGVPAVLRQAVDSLRLTGVCGVIGAPAFGTDVALDVNGILQGRTVRGIVEGDSIPDLFVPAMIDLYRQGRFPFDRLVELYDFDQIQQAASDSEEGSVVKPVVRMPRAA